MPGVLLERIPNGVIKVRESAKATSLEFVLLVYEHGGI